MNTDALIYDDDFYKNQMNGSLKSANIIVAYMLTRFGKYINTVVDFGCGVGAWLSVFEKRGKRVRGYDFGAGAPDNLLVSRDKFELLDLAAAPQNDAGYDLALCLEVGEHLAEKDAECLVARLAAAAPLILFSAAIPGQGGVHHVNEQYPSWWIAKFNAHDFDCYDMLRPKFWLNPDISVWYRQNMILFAKRGNNVPGLDESRKVTLNSGRQIVDMVHPELLAEKTRKLYMLIRHMRAYEAAKTEKIEKA